MAAKQNISERLTRLIDSEETEINIERDPTRRKERVNTFTKLLSELRKVEAFEAKRTSLLTKPAILEWFRNQDPIEAKRFWQEIGRLFEKKSGLA